MTHQDRTSGKTHVDGINKVASAAPSITPSTATSTAASAATSTATTTATSSDASGDASGLVSIKSCLTGSDLPRLERRMLLEHVLDKPRAWLLAHDDACLGADQLERFNRLVAQRIQGVPMAYLVGVRAFMDFEVQVTPDVLIPRPETELLVQKCLDLVATQKAPVLLDLGTGSGVIAIALAKARPDAKVMAVDLSEPAIQVARANAARLGVSVQFLCGSWFAPFSAPNPNDSAATVSMNCAPNSVPNPPLKFDLIVSNPPYIHHQDPHLQQGDLRFEPRAALTDGDDGLSALRTIITESKNWLKPGGSLWLEHGYDQGSEVRSLLQSSGYVAVATEPDLAGHERISGGMLPAR